MTGQASHGTFLGDSSEGPSLTSAVEAIIANTTAFVQHRQRPCLLLVAFPICEHVPPMVEAQLEGCSSEKGIDVIVESNGGDPNAAYVIVRELRRQFPSLSVFVPQWAKSAATLLCLAADELVLGRLGELGPLDTQLRERTHGDLPRTKSCLERFKALEQLQRHSIETFQLLVQSVLDASGMRALEACGVAAEFTGRICGPMYSRIDPDTLGQDARYLQIGEEYAQRILRRYRPTLNDKKDDIVEAFVRGYPSHDFVIDLEELKELGVPARATAGEETVIIDALGDALLALRPVFWDGGAPGIVKLLTPADNPKAEGVEGEEEAEAAPGATANGSVVIAGNGEDQAAAGDAIEVQKVG